MNPMEKRDAVQAERELSRGRARIAALFGESAVGGSPADGLPSGEPAGGHSDRLRGGWLDRAVSGGVEPSNTTPESSQDGAQGKQNSGETANGGGSAQRPIMFLMFGQTSVLTVDSSASSQFGSVRSGCGQPASIAIVPRSRRLRQNAALEIAYAAVGDQARRSRRLAFALPIVQRRGVAERFLSSERLN